MRAQTIRANLFANATRTSIPGLRASSPPSHVPRLRHRVRLPLDDDAV